MAHDLSLFPRAELEDMLSEREARAETQRRLLAPGSGLVCLSMNMAGPVKDFPLLREGFREGCRLAENAMTTAKARFSLAGLRQGKCGPCAFYRVQGDLKQIKTELCEAEEIPNLGRLLDIDVLDETGTKLSRPELGFEARKCLLCGEEAAVCGRSRRHSVAELQQETLRRLDAYFSEKYADLTAACCGRAMLYEVSVSPKPGLVDRLTNGAHHDMDFFTFVDSTAALTPWFRNFFLLGYREGERDDETLFHRAKKLGEQADCAMFAATGGVNTHKGLIYSLGLLCTAAGRLLARRPLSEYPEGERTELLLKEAAALAACSLPNLARDDTHGSEAFRRYGARGIRQEAAAGFPSVTEHVLPNLFQKDGPLEERGRWALLELFTAVEDTNVLHRGGREALEDLSRRAGALLAEGYPVSAESLAAMDRALTEENVSPGGCADLLAIGYFLYFFNGLN